MNVTDTTVRPFAIGEMVHPRRGGGGISDCQGLGHFRVEPVSRADQECSLDDLDVLIAGVAVRAGTDTHSAWKPAASICRARWDHH